MIESLHESGNDEIGSRLEIKRLFLIRIVSVNDVDDYEQYDHGDYEPNSEHFQPLVWGFACSASDSAVIITFGVSNFVATGCALRTWIG